MSHTAIYTRYDPPAPLNDYLDDLYYFDGPAPYSRLKVLPMPSLHLMVNFGQVFHRNTGYSTRTLTLDYF